MPPGSSGDPPPVEASCPMTSSVAPSILEAVLQCPKDTVFVDKLSDRSYVVTNITTNERCVLPAGEWAIEHDDDNGSCLVHYSSAGEAVDVQIHEIDEFLKKTVYVIATGEQFVAVSKGEGAVGQKPYSLDHSLTAHVVAELKVKLQVTNATSTMKAVVMQLPRSCASRVFFAFDDLYSFLGITGYGGQSSKWVWHCLAAWEKQLTSVLAPDLIMFSKHGNTGEKSLDQRPWRNRCLDRTVCWLCYVGGAF
jgi:hypothetical protein